jgi:acetyl esterase/lipase
MPIVPGAEDSGAPVLSKPTGLAADLMLRFNGGRLRARVHWPQPVADNRSAALVLLLAGVQKKESERERDAFGEALSAAAAAVVLSVPLGHRPAGHNDHFYRALGWAADHAGELAAEPNRLAVAGTHAGGAHAAWLAIAARDGGWPPLTRQLLIHPFFTTAAPIPPDPVAVAPATIVSAPAVDGRGTRYAARLRAFGIEVEELHSPTTVAPAGPPLGAVARTLCSSAHRLRNR